MNWNNFSVENNVFRFCCVRQNTYNRNRPYVYRHKCICRFCYSFCIRCFFFILFFFFVSRFTDETVEEIFKLTSNDFFVRFSAAIILFAVFVSRVGWCRLEILFKAFDIYYDANTFCMCEWLTIDPILILMVSHLMPTHFEHNSTNANYITNSHVIRDPTRAKHFCSILYTCFFFFVPNTRMLYILHEFTLIIFRLTLVFIKWFPVVVCSKNCLLVCWETKKKTKKINRID